MHLTKFLRFPILTTMLLPLALGVLSGCKGDGTEIVNLTVEFRETPLGIDVE